MGKTAAKNKTTKVAQDEIERLAQATSAKQQFVSSALDMGWRLALTVIVPVFLGTWLDNRYHTSPSYTLVALFIAIAGACVVVWKTIKDLSKDQGNNKDK